MTSLKTVSDRLLVDRCRASLHQHRHPVLGAPHETDADKAESSKHTSDHAQHVLLLHMPGRHFRCRLHVPVPKNTQFAVLVADPFGVDDEVVGEVRGVVEQGVEHLEEQPKHDAWFSVNTTTLQQREEWKWRL